MSHVLSAAELSELIATEPRLRLLDVRWRLDRPDGRADHLAGHIAGAVYVDLDGELAAPGDPSLGRHPLPASADLQDAARRWGVNAGDVVVAYDDVRGIAAARAWWLLRQAGVDVKILDGGLRAWTAAGHVLESGTVTPTPGDIELAEIGADALSIDEAAVLPASGILIDVRAPERYRGESEPLDPAAGHIPGAVNVPTGELFAADGLLLGQDALRRRFADAGVTEDTPVAAYCGSGIAATHTALVLSEIGIEAAVFPGSWSQWSRTDGRPVATGARPQGGVAEAVHA
ncbi:sulfurtransferase [Microbacterium sp. NPDC056234]|uniref:sulfurtransferase n=1 Tax=Microbacterium sp. NPDC056234 TaxID=3345757 RepID=UPI0035D780DB